MSGRNLTNIIVQKFVKLLLVVCFGLSVMNIETTTNAVTISDETSLDSSYGTQYSKEQIGELVTLYAKRYGTQVDPILATIECESHFKNVQSNIYSDGVREDSWGISQIHLPSHPLVSKSDALNPEYATEFIVKEFSRGNSWKWSCYKTGKYLKYL